MGQILSEPMTAKQTFSEENTFLSVASSSMQGWRVSMEDAHTQLLSIPDEPGTSYFGVFDGHGGSAIARHVSLNLHRRIFQDSAYRQGDIETAMKNGYLDMDDEMHNDVNFRADMSGTTAITVILKGGTLYCANAGDSRAIASVNGEVLLLSNDHKPNCEQEAMRITDAGGWVQVNRVNGSLALSRALGDFMYKKNSLKSSKEQMVTAYPEVIQLAVTDACEFVVMACDGIWDVMSNREVLQFVRSRIAQGIEPAKICEQLVTMCLAPSSHAGGIGCDNMTILLICFLNGSSYDDLSIRCARPCPLIAVCHDALC